MESTRARAAVVCLLIAAVALIGFQLVSGCRPQGMGTIKMGDPAEWHPEPTVPEPPSRRGQPPKSARTQPPDPAQFKSPKDAAKERTLSP